MRMLYKLSVHGRKELKVHMQISAHYDHIYAGGGVGYIRAFKVTNYLR